MTTDDFAKVMDAISKMLSVILWPGLALFVLYFFRRSLRAFFDGLSEVSFKGAGLEASAKRTQIEAAATIAAAAAVDPREPSSPREAAQAAAELVIGSLTNSAVRKARRTKILWVDDRPESNLAEREALEALGIGVTTASSTEDALDSLATHRFDLVISDMGRPPDERAGYTLLSEMRSKGIRLPFVIYSAGGNMPAHRAEAARRGAIGSTNKTTELFEMIFGVLRS